MMMMILVVATCPAQEETSAGTAVAPTTEPGADFSRAFGLLRGLGLPSVKDALPRRQDQRHYGVDAHEADLAGLIWEKKSADGGRVVVVGQTLEMPAVNQAGGSAGGDAAGDGNLRQMMMMSSMNRGGASTEAGQVMARLVEPVEVNRLRNGKPDLDIAKGLVLSIGKFDADMYESWRIDGTLGFLGRTLIFAAQIDERGHKEMANQLARAALTTPAGAEPVVASAVTLMAEAAYARAFHAFLKTGDMQVWKSELDAIVAKFSRGYLNAAAVKLAAADAAAAITSKPIGHPEAEAMAKQWRVAKLDEATLLHVREAVAVAGGGENSARFYDMGMDGGPVEPKQAKPWILDPSLAEAKDPLGQLLARGVDAIPVLVAMVPDTSATSQVVSLLRPATSGFSFSYSNRASATERALEHYRTGMPRPATVGEIATALLAAVITGLDADEPMPGPDEITAMVEAWQSGLNERTPRALADHYFEQGNPVQQSAAMELFLAEPESGRMARVEAHLLAQRPRAAALTMIESYLEKRGPEAAGFLEKFRLEVEAEMAEGGADYFQEEWNIYSSGTAAKKELKSRIKALSAHVGKVDIDAILDQVAGAGDSSQDPFAEGSKAAIKAMAKLPPAEIHVRWLGAMERTNKITGRRNLIELAGQVLKPVELDEAARGKWKALLEDQRMPFNEQEINAWGADNLPTLGQMASHTFLAIQARGGGMTRERNEKLSSVLDTREFYELMRQRALVIAAGQSPPPWPDEAMPDEAAVRAMVAKLDALPAGEVAAAITALPPGDKLALVELETPCAGQVRASRLVREVNLHDPMAKRVPAAGQWAGRPLELAMIDELTGAMLKPGKSMMMEINQDSLFRGLTIQSRERPLSRLPDDLPLKKNALRASVELAGAGSDDEGSSQEALLTVAEDLAALPGESKKPIEEAEQKFRAILEKALAPENQSALRLNLYFMLSGPGAPRGRGAIDAILE